MDYKVKLQYFIASISNLRETSNVMSGTLQTSLLILVCAEGQQLRTQIKYCKRLQQQYQHPGRRLVIGVCHNSRCPSYVITHDGFYQPLQSCKGKSLDAMPEYIPNDMLAMHPQPHFQAFVSIHFLIIYSMQNSGGGRSWEVLLHAWCCDVMGNTCS